MYDVDCDSCHYLDPDETIPVENCDLVIVQLNIRGLYSKIDKLKTLQTSSYCVKPGCRGITLDTPIAIKAEPSGPASCKADNHLLNIHEHII